MAYTTLVDTGQLEKHLSSWRLFDCRHDLGKPQLGEQQYREAHIPGALFAHLDRDLSAPRTGANGRHPLPDRGAFIAWLGQQGLKPGEQEPIDPIAGRIPGAKNRFSNDNLGPQGIFKKPQLLRDEFRAVLGDRAPEEVVSYCGSGVAACHNLLAMELAGLRGGKLYAGSWSEWIADPAREREKG